jgi:predicted dehydrogenase
VSALRIGIVGCGRAARTHAARLARIATLCEIVGCVDTEPVAAESLSALIAQSRPDDPSKPPQCFAALSDLLTELTPEAVAIFTPHRSHYRLAVEALQAGCHVFVEKPLSTNTQEAVDIANLARARRLTVAVGHQYRLLPSLREARRRLAEGEIGPLLLVSATLAAPWFAAHQSPADSWRLDTRVSGGGMLADAGDHLLDALLWASGRQPLEAAAFQSLHAPGLDILTAASVRLSDNALATIGLSARSTFHRFEIEFHGGSGHLIATDRSLVHYSADGSSHPVPLPEADRTIDQDFVLAILENTEPCCPAREAVETVRLLEAIARSGSTGQVVRVA